MKVFGSEEVSLANEYQRMVAKLAWGIYSKIPIHSQSWISVEDLIQDGMSWVVLKGIPSWDHKHKLSTIIHWGVQNYLTDQYLKHLICEKRRETMVIGLLDSNYHSWVGETEVSLKNCYVVPMIMRIYDYASPELKTELLRWFLTSERNHLATLKFRMASREFRRLALREGLDINDCRHLLTNEICLKSLSRSLMN